MQFTHFFRNTLTRRSISITLLIAFAGELLLPISAYAIGGGPSQPEATGFAQAGASDMVDPFTGDFNYNIPLLDVDGYPVNLAYTSGISMEQDATWVGLGWTLNVGALNRSMRGLPDDFNGDQVTKELNIKNNHTFGIDIKASDEIAGIDKKYTDPNAAGYSPQKNDDTNLKDFGLGKLKAGLGINWNNYTGMGVELSICPPINASRGGFGLTGSMGIKASSAKGSTFDFALNPSYTHSKKTGETKEYGFALGLPYNSITGLSQITYGMNSKRRIFSALQAAGASFLNFEYPFQVPQTRMNMRNVNLSIAATLGLAGYAIHGNVRMTGYYSGQFLRDKNKNLPAYGYLNTQNGQNNKAAMLDFNREKDGAYSENTPRLPLTNYTYDVLSASGQGISGTYRPYRNDIGVMRDDEVRSYSAGMNAPGLEFGASAAFHFGGNFSVNATDGYSGIWEDDNNIYPHIRAVSTTAGFNEAYYYKKIGDKTPGIDATFFDKIKGYEPIRVNLTDRSQTARNEFEPASGNGSTLTASVVKNEGGRAKRNEPLFGIMAQDEHEALNKTIRVYDFITPSTTVSPALFGPGKYTSQSRLSRPGHHMTEYTAVNTSGVRYIYGIPAYNNSQQDVNFSVRAASTLSSCNEPGVFGKVENEALITYDNNGEIKDNTSGNKKGMDHFFEKVSTPEYAHSYLLTAVLSDDYADLTDNGPSDDDKGTYTKFNYSRILSYPWRTPFTAEKNSAFYNPGIGIDEFDDRGSYVYGDKELWYLHSIETKNYIAVFFTENRDDGYCAKDENGERGTTQSKLLRKIALYVKSDLLNTKSGHKPVPVKVVHFEYDYSLCDGVPSNGAGTGKLTLKKVYFTYGNSTRAAQRGYKFDYQLGSSQQQEIDNPAYAHKASDRWGFYKPETGVAGDPTNADYPYAEQNKQKADEHARAWNLKQIALPSGGIINIEYEADDYGFVQNRKPMQMFTVLGSNETKDDQLDRNMPTSDVCTRKDGILYEEATLLNGGTECSPYEYFYLRVSEPVKDKEELKQKYFTDENGTPLQYLYYKFYVKTKEGQNYTPSNYEVIPGYIKADDFEYGVCSSGKDVETHKTKDIWIRLKPVNIGDYIPTGNANPISKAAWNFLRVRYPRLGQGRADYSPDAYNPMAIFQELSSSIYQLLQTFTGYFFSLRKQNIARKFDCDKSVFRLYNPNHTKLGGGSRVRKITLDDRFRALTNDNNAYTNETYGKEYFYKTMHYGQPISSGVAAYEPLLGGEESPFKAPLIMGTDQRFMAIGNDYLQESTFGESFFPMASVGYSKITVKSLRDGKNNSRSTETGKEELEFYTSKDFPNFVNETGVEAYRTKPELLFTFMKFYSFDQMAVSQGYAVELNDMNGKQKAVKSFSEYNDTIPVNSTEYFYKRDLQQLNKLYNYTTTVDHTGKIKENVQTGIEVDVVADMRQEQSRTHGGSFGGNLDAFIAFVPMVLPSFFPKYTQEKVMFRSAVVTKVVNRSGILDSVVVKDNGARKITHNLAVDDESGEVLVTRINNNFDDPVYQVNLPAYWMYDEMSHAYKRMSGIFSIKDVLNNPGAYLKEGDEVDFGGYHAWVVNTSPTIGLLSNTGIFYDLQEIYQDEDINNIKIIRPANHNKINLPASATIVKQNPLTGNELYFNEVIDANAKFYSDNWKVFCGCNNIIGAGYNPYIAGRRGNYKVVKEFVFLTNRTQTKYNNNLNVRRDGIYTTFSPFWNYDLQWQPDSANWTFASENTLMSATGALLESRDALNRYSSAQFAFADRAQIAIGQNAMYREIGFESFEDYDFLDAENCKQGHFTFYDTYKNGVNGMLIGTKSAISVAREGHSGKYSLKISNQDNYIRIRKIISPCK